MNIRAFEAFHCEFPFRLVFRHSRKSRRSSSSIILRCELADGTVGYGECLPRPYVTGEDCETVLNLLADRILPNFIGREFETYGDLESWCAQLYPWLERQFPDLPSHYGATCCAIELALLDAFGRHFGRSLLSSDPVNIHYSGVISAGSPFAVLALALRCHKADLPAIKLKVGTRWDALNVQICRAVFGNSRSIRVDANGAWSLPEAITACVRLRKAGVDHVEQPFPQGRIEDLLALRRESDIAIIVDEDLRNMSDAEALATARACHGFNLRLSKLGGFFPSLRIAEYARRNNIMVQIGCQVGETALLSSAGLALAQRVGDVQFMEGFFGTYLLQEDIASSADGRLALELRFGKGGEPPEIKAADGLGIHVNPEIIKRYAVERRRVEPPGHARTRDYSSRVL